MVFLLRCDRYGEQPVYETKDISALSLSSCLSVSSGTSSLLSFYAPAFKASDSYDYSELGNFSARRLALPFSAFESVLIFFCWPWFAAGGFSSSKSDMILCFSRSFRSIDSRKSVRDYFRFSSLLKNFWACERACVEVLLMTCSWTFFHSLPNSFSASKKRKCSSFVHRPIL